jgi:hypothetical protein
LLLGHGGDRNTNKNLGITIRETNGLKAAALSKGIASPDNCRWLLKKAGDRFCIFPAEANPSTAEERGP